MHLAKDQQHNKGAAAGCNDQPLDGHRKLRILCFPRQKVRRGRPMGWFLSSKAVMHATAKDLLLNNNCLPPESDVAVAASLTHRSPD
jgi:hypothetical protein